MNDPAETKLVKTSMEASVTAYGGNRWSSESEMADESVILLLFWFRVFLVSWWISGDSPRCQEDQELERVRCNS